MQSSKTFPLTFKGETPQRSGKFLKQKSMRDHMSTRKIMREERAEFVTSTAEGEDRYKARVDGSLIGSLAEAFVKHYHLKIRPDDVWLSIIITFANYASQYSDEMADYFPKDIFASNTITIDALTDQYGNLFKDIYSWKPVLSEFVTKIDNTIHNAPIWMIPNFTTTTKKDRMIGHLAIMGSVKKFLNYTFKYLCGIPQVTMYGTRDDWQLLIQNVEEIEKIGREANRAGLVDWCAILKPVLEKFLDSYDGNVDNDFWQSCIFPSSGYSKFDYISGWALAFAPFNEGRWQLYNPDYILETGNYGKVDFYDFNINHSIEVPIKMVNSSGSTMRNVVFYAGGLLCDYNGAQNSVAPVFDIVMFTVSDEVMNVKISSKTKVNERNDDATRPRHRIKDVSRALDLPMWLQVPWHAHKLGVDQSFEMYTCDICEKRIGPADCVTSEMRKPDYFNIAYAQYKCQSFGCESTCCLSCAKEHMSSEPTKK